MMTLSSSGTFSADSGSHSYNIRVSLIAPYTLNPTSVEGLALCTAEKTTQRPECQPIWWKKTAVWYDFLSLWSRAHSASGRQKVSQRKHLKNNRLVTRNPEAMSFKGRQAEDYLKEEETERRKKKKSVSENYTTHCTASNSETYLARKPWNYIKEFSLAISS